MADTETDTATTTEAQAQSAAPESLPYRVTTEKFNAGLDALRQTPGSSEVFEVAVGKNDKSFISRALGVLGLKKPGAWELTDAGRVIAYSQGEERHLRLLRVLFKYEPYKLVLMEAARRKVTALNVPEIVRVWGQANFGSNDDNRTAAATAFGAMLEAAGVGRYVLGRRKNPSRQEFPADLSDRLKKALSQEEPGAAGLENGQPAGGLSQSSDSEPASVDVDPEPGFVRHNFPLRRDMTLTFDLPENLTTRDVKRLANWLQTLPFEEDENRSDL